MSAYPVDVADVSTPASDCSSFPISYNIISQPGSIAGMPSFSGFSGFNISNIPNISGQWDGAVEGTQNSHNFVEYSSQAQDSDYAASASTPAHQQPKYLGLPTPDSSSSTTSVGSVAMRRSVSRSSAGSYHSQRPSQRKQATRPRIHTPVSAASSVSSASSAAPAYGIYQDGTANDLQSYFNVQSHQYMPGGYAYSMHSVMGPAYQQTYQHIDPACTQMGLDFDTSAAPSVCSQTWNTSENNSRHSSPDAAVEEDRWMPPMSSPAESHGSMTSSQREHGDSSDGSSEHSGEHNSDHSSASSMSSSTSDSGSRRLSHSDEDFEIPAAAAALQQKRSSSESSDTARDHYLYKNVACGADGLYHCPWEGKSQCSHKPEKLKCNYDKFVDSHLKPYRCKHSSCENARFSSTACLLRHEREAHAMHGHGDKPYLCPYPGCDRAQPGFGFPRQWNLKDHMRRVHRDDGNHAQQQVQQQVAVSVYESVASSASAVSKNRKRKKELLSSSSSASIVPSSTSSSRKSSASSRAAMAEAQAQAQAAQLAQAQAQVQAQAEAYAAQEAEKVRIQMEQWTQSRNNLLDLVNAGLESPNDPKIQTQLQLIQEQVDRLNQIAAACFLTQETVPYMHFSQQSG